MYTDTLGKMSRSRKKKSLIVLVKGARENLPLAEKNSQMCQLLTYSTTKRTFGVRISE